MIWAAVAAIATVVMAIVAIIGLFYKKDKKNSVHTESIGNERTPNTDGSGDAIKNTNMGRKQRGSRNESYSYLKEKERFYRYIGKK